MRKVNFKIVPYIFLLQLLSGCNSDTGNGINERPVVLTEGYNLVSPDKISTLPIVLKEISGITTIDSANIACIQDEKGIVFVYNEKENKITSHLQFNNDGDYEGIARVGDTLYILRSDGMLFEVSGFTSGILKHQSFNTGVPAKDNEGLCFDALHNRLLIACKSKPGKDPGFKDKRCIYSFDLSEKKLSDQPVFDVDLSVIQNWVENFKAVPGGPFEKYSEHVSNHHPVSFKPSAIAIHPVSKNLFLLSSADHLLFIFDELNKPVDIIPLNQEIFYQPEGISFYENGDMLISNEGKTGKPTLLFFKYNH